MESREIIPSHSVKRALTDICSAPLERVKLFSSFILLHGPSLQIIRISPDFQSVSSTIFEGSYDFRFCEIIDTSDGSFALVSAKKNTVTVSYFTEGSFKSTTHLLTLDIQFMSKAYCKKDACTFLLDDNEIWALSININSKKSNLEILTCLSKKMLYTSAPEQIKSDVFVSCSKNLLVYHRLNLFDLTYEVADKIDNGINVELQLFKTYFPEEVYLLTILNEELQLLSLKEEKNPQFINLKEMPIQINKVNNSIYISSAKTVVFFNPDTGEQHDRSLRVWPSLGMNRFFSYFYQPDLYTLYELYPLQVNILHEANSREVSYFIPTNNLDELIEKYEIGPKCEYPVAESSEYILREMSLNESLERSVLANTRRSPLLFIITFVNHPNTENEELRAMLDYLDPEMRSIFICNLAAYYSYRLENPVYLHSELERLPRNLYFITVFNSEELKEFASIYEKKSIVNCCELLTTPEKVFEYTEHFLDYLETTGLNAV